MEYAKKYKSLQWDDSHVYVILNHTPNCIYYSFGDKKVFPNNELIEANFLDFIRWYYLIKIALKLRKGHHPTTLHLFSVFCFLSLYISIISICIRNRSRYWHNVYVYGTGGSCFSLPVAMNNIHNSVEVISIMSYKLYIYRDECIRAKWFPYSSQRLLLQSLIYQQQPGKFEYLLVCFSASRHASSMSRQADVGEWLVCNKNMTLTHTHAPIQIKIRFCLEKLSFTGFLVIDSN